MPTQSRLTRTPRRAEEPQPHVSYGVVVAAAWAWRTLVIVAALAVVYYVLAFFSELLIPLLLSALLAALLVPLVDLLERRQIPRVVATLVVLLMTIAIVVGLLTLVGTQIVTGFSALSAQVTEGLATAQEWLRTGPFKVSSNQLSGYLTQAQEAVSSNSERLVTEALSLTTTAAGVLTGLFLVFFLSLFLIYDGRKVWSWTVHLLPQAAVEPMDAAARRGWVTLTAYVRATVIVAFTDALGIYIGALILKIPLAVPLAVLVFLAAFVPIVGALLSGSVAVLIGLVAQGPVVALIMLGVVLFVQQLESHVLQPFLLGKAVSVHPIAVILSITAGTVVAGIPGALFAVPFVAVMNTIVTYLVRGDEGEEAELPDGASEAPLAPDPVDDEASRAASRERAQREDAREPSPADAGDAPPVGQR